MADWLLLVAWMITTAIAAALAAASFVHPSLQLETLLHLSDRVLLLVGVLVGLLTLNGIVRGESRPWRVARIAGGPSSTRAWLVGALVLFWIVSIYAFFFVHAGTVAKMDGQWFHVGRSFRPIPISTEQATNLLWNNVRRLALPATCLGVCLLVFFVPRSFADRTGHI
ncbi:MAG: hypothetical protein ACXVH5_11175 [Ilumatobacteraceae bacterium]